MIFDPNIIHYLIPIAHAAEEATADTGIAGTFGIDWMKFIAQLINFAVVLLILWKWVFTPVTKKLEERTAKIEKAMKDATNTEKEKQAFSAWKLEEMSNARKESNIIITEAKTEAEKVKDQILQDAKFEQQKLVGQAKEKIIEEQQKAISAAKGELADLVTNATEKIIRQKLNSTKDQELIKESLRTIK